MLEWLAGVSIGAGLIFFLAGTLGLLRFPDVYTRLHALTKADNTGLGLIAAGVAILSGTWQTILLIALIWFLAVTAASIACHLVARHRLRDEGEDGPS